MEETLEPQMGIVGESTVEAIEEGVLAHHPLVVKVVEVTTGLGADEFEAHAALLDDLFAVEHNVIDRDTILDIHVYCNIATG